ncbi:MAG: asparagine synthase (glutamine-hydrolyzing) [Candidatus Electrothrix sp. YB6]
MCGIAGIYSYHSAAPAADRKELRRIRDHMATRGPDGSDEWFSADRRVALGHRRLAIIDLSQDAAQPMSSPNDMLVVSFNGEIYNYQALRDRLEAEGYQFRTRSDTEVLLHLYAKKGPAMVDDLRGMFAFALWDERQKKLLLARDPYGIKPLYYADNGRTLRFASQVKALMAGGRISRTVEPAGVAGLYLFGSVPEPWTLYQDIRSVPAGSYILADETGMSPPVQYFSPAATWTDALKNVPEGQLNEEDIQKQIRAAVLDSVRHHMVADVPVGAFLSAGIDSGTLVALMSETGTVRHTDRHSLNTITLAFQEFEGQHENETLPARQIAEQYGTEHVTRLVTEQEFRQDLPTILAAMDQPSIDGINTWFVAKAAKEQGLKVAVSGLGGDELFGGYPSFTDIPRWVSRLSIASKIPLAGRLFRKGYTAYRRMYPAAGPKLAGLLEYGGTWAGAWLLRRGIFMPWELQELMGREQAEAGLERLQPLQHIASLLQPEPESAFAKVAVLESSLYMRNQLLRDADWAGMAHSLEIRVPLVDAVLFQRIARLISSVGEGRGQEQWKRWLGRTPHRSLPHEILNRTKTGFSIPMDKWIRHLHAAGESAPALPEKHEKHTPWARTWVQYILSRYQDRGQYGA